ncbi:MULTISPECIES: TetR/AcrR family transcriptional regulator [Chroococcidiopsis]|jgi:TetR/AcrR family transcriptional regulator, mexJK operon transcriptional repressor|uniref:Transcriptional regulator, TetR family n=1 Tax=Chroococcidiopsis thermalis (strain PCC 7203) TaxID=251229 RepID=K9TVA6_CHRTP|nr:MULTISPECIES: TetR/AcrR family transcriptional regulator [Chroococcidiopsis]MBE9018286.1 TetR/AcrR family transcriptional regulator [Chroococcidiopsidales cyanobacterium LEGE 13417]PSB43710.1 TetR/AcrR family transcriptional regulator [Cyanosarcina cf. burmensis CCALA 770]AFY86308.1 transcriptional regulator, TetR family [Chroococcidiopsis thermalis PCC 7203]PSM47873.1 TetR/AcrR family transcriptional regulator [Chroococcidiopsis sp. CCALA 051]URD51166.1 TetR/AcrR family transcriptional reg
MPPRDDRDFEDKRQQIIDGALQVFASKGFEKATNKDIAAASGIGSPGLIYHYFKDKSDLFEQVIEQRLPLLQLLSHSDELMTKPIEDVLTLFGHAFLRMAENPTSLALFKLIMGEAIRQPHVAEIVNRIGPSRSVAFLSGYLEQQMAAGVLKPMNPNAAARCFAGSFVAYLLTREVFMQPDAQQLSAEVMVETAVKVFLQGTLVVPIDE